MESLWREVARLQAAIVEYDYALQWRECPWREQIEANRKLDLAILDDYVRAAISSPLAS